MAPKAEQPTLFEPAPLPVAKFGDAETLACLRLIRSENVGPVAFRELINRYGGAQRALDALPEIAKRARSKRPVRVCPASDAQAELETAERIGARPVFTIEPGYPSALAAIDAPPPMLYVKGRIELLQRPAVAIVGSRMCSAAGSKLAAMFAHRLGEAGYLIVSGLARGIDGAAHRAALKSGTVAVLAGGLDIIYPPEHAELHAEIATDGCLVSEMPPGFKPRGQDFPRRNRIISGISLGVIIVEAAARSGTLVTARYAGEQGRDVFAVPGHPLDPRAEGTNKLIKSGATLVTDAEDVMRVLEPVSGLREGPAHLRWQPREPAPAADQPPPIVGDDERGLVLAVLGPAPVDLDAIQRATGLSTRAVQIALMELDLAGHITRPGTGLIARRDSA
ncbi:MAG: DNA-protecting protein DprA [Hyphomicrobium sp.]|nr:DNA-protecting protein DprA [Hyphomicrobium sp.]